MINQLHMIGTEEDKPRRVPAREEPRRKDAPGVRRGAGLLRSVTATAF